MLCFIFDSQLFVYTGTILGKDRPVHSKIYRSIFSKWPSREFNSSSWADSSCWEEWRCEQRNTRRKGKTLHKSRVRHGKVVLATDARKSYEESNSETLNFGFDLVRCILQSIQNDQRNRTMTFSSHCASGKKDEDSNPFHGEIRSVSETENARIMSQTRVCLVFDQVLGC